jgi:hypothetical protein
MRSSCAPPHLFLRQHGRAPGLRRPGERLPAARQQLAPAVHDGDAARLQAGHGGGDQVQHRLHAVPVQPLCALHGEHHAGLRLAPLAGKDLAARQRQVDPRRPHPGQAADGAGDLAFQGAQAVHVLLERRGGEGLGPVEDLPADAAAQGQALARQGQPQAGHLVGGGQDAGAARLQPVGHPLLFERGDHRRRVPRLHVAEQRRHRGIAGAHRQGGEQRQQGQARPGQRRQALRPERLQPGHHAAHRATSCGSTRDRIRNPSRRPAPRRWARFAHRGLRRG